MKKILFCLLLSLSFTIVSKSQIPYYYYSVPSGTTSDLKDVWMSTNAYYISGANGTVLRTFYPDSNWNLQSANTNADLNSFIRNVTFRFIFGNNGVFLKTTNSGNNWYSSYTGISENLYGGVFTLMRIIAVGSNGKIFLKKYGDPDTSFRIIPSGTMNNLKSVWFKNQYGWIAGANGIILYSSDTGSSWIQQVSGTTNNLNSIIFRDSLLGYAVGNGGIIIKTTNGGVNWIQKSSNTLQDLNCINIKDSYITYPIQHACISGNKTALFTSDYGETWITDANVPQYNLYSCYYVGDDFWHHSFSLFTGENGKIFKRKIDTAYHVNYDVKLSANNISSIFRYSGIFNQNLSLGNAPAFEWPKGSNKFAIFTTGLCIAGYVNGQLREAMASYKGEYSPGYCVNGNYYLNDYFKIYKVSKNDNAQTNWDWANWGQMVPYGAPFIDVNNNGIYEAAIDTPGVRNAKETIFYCMTDANAAYHGSNEGFGGGTLPLGAEVHLTAWAYDSPGLQDVQFISYDIINKSTSTWNAVQTGIVADPDLGDANDDYIGCDTSVRQLSFCYNGTNNDNIYGINPPAVGITLLKSPLNRSITPNARIGLTTFGFLSKSNGPVCEWDPNPDPYGAYLMLSGFKRDSTCWLDPTYIPPKKTKIIYPGDPETNIGWTEVKGKILNCNHDSTGTIHIPGVPGERRFYFGSGANNFNIVPGESQKFVIAQLIARGNSNLNSVTRLKQLCDSIRNFYEINFPINVNKISNSVPDKFNLFQNYPNPFNPVTNIKYQITKSSLVTLKVYDILGREVTTLVNEYQQAGIYETQFPDNSLTSNKLSSGIYFYKIISGNLSAVKRMLMIK